MCHFWKKISKLKHIHTAQELNLVFSWFISYALFPFQLLNNEAKYMCYYD